jgi:hypothetical protein
VLRDPVLQGDSLIYSVQALQGVMPDKAADVSVFIDIIGMPFTPLSYAGCRATQLPTRLLLPTINTGASVT